MASNLKLGDRIRLLHLVDPRPIPVGSEGTVIRATENAALGFTQIEVDWDSGIRLMLTVPPDRYQKLP